MKTARIISFFITLLLTTGVRAQSAESVLRPGDSIMVKLSGVPTEEISIVSNSYDISDGGTINLPYIGEVKASGLRPSDLQKKIESAYKTGEIYTHPTILVSSDKTNNTQVVFVSGEVKVPNRYNMVSGMSVHDAITSAGGPNEWANMRHVKLTRGDTTRELDLRKADNPDARIKVEVGDRIHVPK